jgi:hypothetical protein
MFDDKIDLYEKAIAVNGSSNAQSNQSNNLTEKILLVFCPKRISK